MRLCAYCRQQPVQRMSRKAIYCSIYCNTEAYKERRRRRDRAQRRDLPTHIIEKILTVVSHCKKTGQPLPSWLGERAA